MSKRESAHSDLLEAESIYLYVVVESYYHTYLRYPDNIEVILSHGESIRDMSSAVYMHIQDSSDFYGCVPTDSTMLVTFRDDTILFMEERLRCKDFSFLLAGRFGWPIAFGLDDSDSVHMFLRGGADGFYKSIKSLYEDLKEGYRPVRNKEVYDSTTLNSYPACKDDAEIPVLVMYQYTPADGLSVHPICQECFSIHNNGYITALSQLAEQVCRQYGLTYLRFLAYDMTEVVQ